MFLRADLVELQPPTSSEWLCAVPAAVLNRTDTASARVRAVAAVHIDHSIINWADVVVVERSTFAVTELAIEVWKSHGKRVLLRFDDAYGVMPKMSSSYGVWHGMGIRGMTGYERFLATLPLFDSYSTPSKLLTEDLLPHHSSGVYIPNRPDMLHFPQPAPLRWLPKRFNLVWGGSMPHRQSWVGSEAADGVNDALRKWPDEYRLLLLCDRPWFPELFKVPYTTFPWVPIQEYRQRLKAVAHIGLAPLHGEYDMRRSWIKVLVYALLGIPWIASDAPPYQDCKGGWLVSDDRVEWEAAIGGIALPENYIDLRREGLQWAWGEGIAEHIEEWTDWLGGDDEQN